MKLKMNTGLICMMVILFVSMVSGQFIPLEEIQRCSHRRFPQVQNPAHELEKNKNCQLWKETFDLENEKGPYKFCSGNHLCELKRAKEYAPEGEDVNKNLGLNQYCEKGFHPGETGNAVRLIDQDGQESRACFALANSGCTIASEKRDHIACYNKLAYTEGGSCPTPEQEDDNDDIVVGLGDECGHTQGEEDDQKSVVCGYNLVCSAQRKCVKRSAVNGPCSGDGSLGNDNHHLCQNGLLCHFNRCIRRLTLPNGASCHNNDACGSGYCHNRVCSPTLTRSTCRKDADCNEVSSLTNGEINSQTWSVCRVSDPQNFGKSGRCTAFFLPQKTQLQRCIANRCHHAKGESGYTEACEKNDFGSDDHPCQAHWVRMMCARTCVDQIDRRYTWNTPYTFDCQAGTATAWDSTSCEVKEQFLNCEAVLRYPSGASSSTFSVGAVIIGMIVLLFNL